MDIIFDTEYVHCDFEIGSLQERENEDTWLEIANLLLLPDFAVTYRVTCYRAGIKDEDISKFDFVWFNTMLILELLI